MTGFRIADTFTDSLAKLTGDEQNTPTPWTKFLVGASEQRDLHIIIHKTS
jgi:hypothetical protein